MTFLASLQSVKTAYCAMFASIILVPDLLLELLLEVLHLLFEVLHVAFECVESVLDHAVEHMFHTGLHETQVIVFYIICTVATILLYFLIRAMPRYFRRLQAKFLALLADTKNRVLHYFSNLLFSPKVKGG